MLPSFIIVGAIKAGTTTLSQLLDKHPMLRTSSNLEPHFFDQNFDKGILWYKKQFPLLFFNARKTAFEATPFYLYHPLVPQRIAETLPQVKIVVLLRNPIERAISHFKFNVKKGIEYLDFKEAIQRENEFIEQEKELLKTASNYQSKLLQNFSYIDMGYYDRQLEIWFKHISRDKMLFLDAKKLHNNPQETIDELLAFVGANSFKVNTGNLPLRSGIDDMSKEIFNQLVLAYDPTMQWVKAETGINLEL